MIPTIQIQLDPPTKRSVRMTNGGLWGCLLDREELAATIKVLTEAAVVLDALNIKPPGEDPKEGLPTKVGG